MGAEPFLKWAGGKRWLVPEILELNFPTPERYGDPFLGSGPIFFALEPKRAVLADSNEWLIETYRAVRDTPDKVFTALARHQRLHSKDHYYKVRSARPRSSHGRAAQLI